MFLDPAKAYTSNPSFTQQPPKRPLLRYFSIHLKNLLSFFLRNKEPRPLESVIHSSSFHAWILNI
ncbi:hypothetical protein D8674_034263 [Pyrus ussuriensis x Pyrus communis]|uniref:Uncharacterized protein n=1 Tax=Pyrus ussuriensis x Pyrus communis TaxID=2448454 RepID=A0A5N5HPF5_9ROSA|nr:hypothetical protein D8674_034263 [Pyrus ussuriensis x Pyrus communis]